MTHQAGIESLLEDFRKQEPYAEPRYAELRIERELTQFEFERKFEAVFEKVNHVL